MARMPDNVEWIQYPGQPRKYVAYGNGAWKVWKDRTSNLWHAQRGQVELIATTLRGVALKVEKHTQQ